MKKEDAVKKMTAVKAAVEKSYPGVKADIVINDWEKGGYHRLYISLLVTGQVNGKTTKESADFGFINLKTNRYNTRAYDMCHFDAGEFTPAKGLYEYAEAYKTADDDKTLYTAKENFRLTLGLSKTEEENGISRKEMLDKSFEMWISPDNFGTYWRKINVGEKSTNEEDMPKKDEKSEKIGSYDDHIVTISPSTDKYVVKDNGKYTGDYEDDREGGVYEAAMYLYDRMMEGHVITVINTDAWSYIVENANGLHVPLNINTEVRTIKKG